MTEGIPHPRDTFADLGLVEPEAAFLAALEGGRFHHAWLLQGPEGVGKASFAYRAARRLLGATPAPAFGALGAAPEDRVCRQISARSHPDLMVLQCEVEEGKARTSIPVDEARQLPEFFSKSPASAPYRVAIIDAADDMNDNAANAVLKTLEEPPPRGVLFLIAHRPGALLGTIRSRCRRLSFHAPEPEAAAAWLAARTTLGPEERRRALSLARGAPGLAWRIAETGVLELDRLAGELLAAADAEGPGKALTLLAEFRAQGLREHLWSLFQRLADRVRERAVALTDTGAPPVLERMARLYQGLIATADAADAVNLDPQDALFTALTPARGLGVF